MHKKHSNEFKFKVALSAIKGDKTINEICKEFNVAPTLVSKWKLKLKQDGAKVFSDSKQSINYGSQEQTNKLYAQIGKLTVENDFLKKNILD